MQTTIYCPDITCGSCTKVIKRSLEKYPHVESIAFGKDSITVVHAQELPSEDLLRTIHERGFRADFEPFTRKTFRERFRDFRENKEKYSVEYSMIQYSIITFFLLMAIEAVTYLALYRSQPGFLERYGIWALYLNLAIVSIGAAIWHFKSYRGEVSTMVGMMIGMTFGMQSGFLIGVIFGATNGMFTGTMIAMLSATLIGWYNGKCCGIMGILEGMMAGTMGGIMGAMTGVMLFADHILLFMPFFMIITLFVVWGLSYMLYEEFVEDNPKVKVQPTAFTTFFSYCFLAAVIFFTIMIYGPTSGLAVG
ncbi:cation transporter [Candidatus Woesearchaeota archaeon]|nr:cation transporter [Candidatus Woesearchaeota archaeon]